MQKILKLNKHYIAAGVASWKEIIKNIFTESVYPLDLTFKTDDDGKVDVTSLEGFEVIRTWEDWASLEVRPYDDYINTPRTRIRLPSVVVCCNYDKIAYRKVLFPSKPNIWKRDNYTCGYTLKKLNKSNLTVDHIVPKDLGGQDTWENLITCDKEVNHLKGNTPLIKAKFPNDPQKWGQFAGQKFKLNLKPHKPQFAYNQIVFEHFREEWQHFIGE